MRSNGAVQDLRLPLRDGQPVQFLTTRDKDDPDALFVLRHSTAHLLAEAVRRLYPGVKVAIGPPIENGFYYDFEFPEPIREEDLEKIEAEIQRELKEGRSWEREEISAAEAKQRFLEENEPYKAELVDTAEGDISLYTQGEFTDLCRGPHLQDSKPIKAVKLTSLAGAYWRGDEKNTQLTRIYGTAFYSQADLDAHLERLEQAKARDHRRLGRELDLFHFRRALARLAVLASEGDGDLERARGPAAARERAARLRRGEDAADLRQGALGHVAATGRSSARTCSSSRARARSTHCALKPMNCPGHMLLFGCAAAQLPRPADALRRKLDVAPQRARRRAARAPARPPRDAGRCPHLLHRGADRRRRSTAASIREVPLRPLRCHPARGAVDPPREQARHRRGVGSRRGNPAGGARAARDRLRDRRGRGNLLRPEDRPAHAGHARPLLADGDDPGGRADAATVRPHVHGAGQRRAHADS